jgi:hypothetical protein
MMSGPAMGLEKVPIDKTAGGDDKAAHNRR